MENIVTKVAAKAGNLCRLAEIHGVTPQAVWQWEKNGYFPLRQFEVVMRHFPEVTTEQLVHAYKNKKQD